MPSRWRSSYCVRSSSRAMRPSLCRTTVPKTSIASSMPGSERTTSTSSPGAAWRSASARTPSPPTFTVTPDAFSPVAGTESVTGAVMSSREDVRRGRWTPSDTVKRRSPASSFLTTMPLRPTSSRPRRKLMKAPSTRSGSHSTSEASRASSAAVSFRIATTSHSKQPLRSFASSEGSVIVTTSYSRSRCTAGLRCVERHHAPASTGDSWCFSAPGRRLLGLGRLLAGPAAGQAGEPAPAAVVDEPAHQPEDRALDQQGGDQLAELDVAVLGVRRLLLVHQAPELLEDLLGDEAREQTAGDAHRHERVLHLSRPS